MPAQAPDLFIKYARKIIEHRNEEKKAQLPQGSHIPGTYYGVEVKKNRIDPNLLPGKNAEPVGIIGAGPAGMYTGLILQSLGIKYEILEASDRVGGRLETYHFPKKEGHPNGTHDYYDLGAMRYPDTPIMKRTFDLFHYPPLNTGDIQVADKLIPYFFDTKDGNGFYFFNNRRYRENQLGSQSDDPFRASEVGVDSVYIKVGVKPIFDDVIGHFAEGLEYDLEHGTTTGWDEMMKYDSYSTRAYMCHAYKPSDKLVKLGLPKDKSLPTNVVNWLETFDKTTGWYDRALTTTVLEELAFGFTTQEPKPEVKYWCLDGGSEVLTQAMAKYIQRETSNKGILLKHRVTKIAIDNPKFLGTHMNVWVEGEETHRKYPHVISTVPLTCLRHTIDIDGAALNPLQSNALRELQYTPAVKVGIKFRTPWWTTAKDRQGKPLNIVGGRSFTDRPIRIVVYPSYGLGEPDKPAVLIGSFVWTEDAARIGALIGSQDPIADKQLKYLVLKDLADVHDLSLKFLEDQYLDHYPVDWADNPLTMGAFALFGPGKFEDLYSSLTFPAGFGRLHFAGEAVSPRHGWVVGALDSAWRCVAEYLLETNPKRLWEFFEKWGVNQDWINGRSKNRKVPDNKDNLLIEHIGLFAPEVFELAEIVEELEKLNETIEKLGV